MKNKAYLVTAPYFDRHGDVPMGWEAIVHATSHDAAWAVVNKSVSVRQFVDELLGEGYFDEIGGKHEDHEDLEDYELLEAYQLAVGDIHVCEIIGLPQLGAAGLTAA